VTKPVTKQGGPDHAALVKELAQAKARIAELKEALRRTDRGYIWTAKQYRDVEFCTHPDRVAFLNDEALTARFDAAFRTVRSSKGLLVDKDAEERSEQSDRFADEMRQKMSDRFQRRAAQETVRRAKAKATREARSAAALKRRAGRPSA
jgi:hypothetical protein